MKLLTFLPTDMTNDSPSKYPDVPCLRDFVEVAERGLFDGVFMADGIPTPSRNRPDVPEPLTTLSIIAALSQNLGLVASLSTTYNYPYNIARYVASIDHLSGGRAGWNIVSSPMEETALLYGEEFLEHEERYRRAEECVDAVRQLWQSRPESEGEPKIVEISGEHVKLSGALNIPCCPQKKPVLFQAGMSNSGRGIAGRNADAVYVLGADVEHLKELRDDITGAAECAGRDPGSVKIFLGLSPSVKESGKGNISQQSLDTSGEDFEAAIRRVSSLLGTDLSAVDPDTVIPADLLPDVTEHKGSQGTLKLVVDIVKRDSLTPYQLGNIMSSGRLMGRASGSPEELADYMEFLLEKSGIDGFILSGISRAELKSFVGQVIPNLQERGLYRTAYVDGTFRERLGL